MTAAHCIALDASFTVVVGRHNLTDTTVGDDVTKSKKIPHPQYDIRVSDDYDVALVFLSRPTTADVDVLQINTDHSLPAVGAAGVYLGWGEIDTDRTTLNISETLREVWVYAISNEQCEASAGIVDGTNVTDSYDGLITSNMVCTHAKDKDSCQKDSGGPLILRGEDARGDIQIGIASWGIACASKIFPGVAARCSSVYSWIEDTICKNSNAPGPNFECSNIANDNSGIIGVEAGPDNVVDDNGIEANTFVGDDNGVTGIEMSGLDNIFEGDRMRSVATNTQSGNALSIVMFALFCTLHYNII